jgi:hypothetical protein
MIEVNFLLETLICRNDKVSVSFNIPKGGSSKSHGFVFTMKVGSICVMLARFP